MAVINLRLPDDLADRFAAVAVLQGGRSALLRRLIAEAVDTAPPGRAEVSSERPAGRVTVRLTAAAFAALDREAAAMGMTRARWVAALVRRRVLGKPTLARPDILALMATQVALRRVAVALNQTAGALVPAMTAAPAPEPRLAAIESLRAEIRGHMAALRAAFEGNLAYWETP